MSAISHRPGTNGSSRERRTSFASIPTSAASSSQSSGNVPRKLSSQTSLRRRSPNSSFSSSRPLSTKSYTSFQAKQRRLKSQYPLDSPELHVEYILVASFHVDRGPIMEHQYPSAISGDEHMLAELMLPDQTHVRSQDWTIFFLHKDAGSEEENEYVEPTAGQQTEYNNISQENEGLNDDSSEASVVDEDEEDDENGEGPPLMYVLNLVNTKQDTSVKRGAVVKAMAICTRHSFLHIYKPLLLLALEDYFKSPFPETLAALYNSLNAMDLSLLPRFTYLERHILQASDSKDMFIEKFEQMIKQRLADERFLHDSEGSPQKHSSPSPKYTLPRDTHEFESKIIYNDIAIPVKVPSAISPETVGDFSLIKLIQIFSAPHASSPQPFGLHPHLTSSGAYTHPIIVLVNALLTQKRVIFLGHNRPSGEVAEAVLAACSLASGGILRGFTRHAFPYTDLTKIDELLKVPGFVAGVTNPAFANHHEWWDLLCDLPSGRMKISSRIEPAPVTEGSLYFQQQNLTTQPSVLNSASSLSDLTGDSLFMDDILRSVASRHGEGAIRAKWRAYITKFTRISATFEQTVYGATALYVMAPGEGSVDGRPGGQLGTYESLRGHGYVWPDDVTKQRELTAWVSRIEGWRNTRSYYYFIQDTAALYLTGRPVQSIDIHHHHDRLRSLKLSHADSAQIYLALSQVCQDYNSICQLLTVTPESQAGLFYISMGLFHPNPTVREAVIGLLDRISAHEAGRHFWTQLSRFTKLAYFRLKREKESEKGSPNGDLQNDSSGSGWARRS
ncbi:protein mesA [Blastomyces gilchristii SLH14081]|uniref:Protein mesA n=1 Tax=Blastomyces gilchristii (strain SLH14081) TaxID=559298 RepID=A0A179ULL6_BLAGS|nr:protein mesA [Blastomyces gilchristii SLH14081]OAT08864.1 protein mesA [Blastomyces gilchristii SLH14081]